jgi:hypothetical protein
MARGSSPEKKQQVPPLTNSTENAARPFVIPTRISCHAALDVAAYAPFRKEGRKKCDYATWFHRKSGGAKPRHLRFSSSTNHSPRKTPLLDEGAQMDRVHGLSGFAPDLEQLVHVFYPIHFLDVSRDYIGKAGSL